MPDTRYPAHLQDAKHERVKLQGVALYHDSFVNLRIGPDRHRTHTLASTHAPWACLPPQDPKRERVKLLGRRGFARIALEEQVDGIVCVYYFGQSQVLSFGPRSLADISRRIRVSLGVLTGWMGLPVPKPMPIYMVNGRPIPVPKVSRDAPDFEQQVDKLLNATIDELQAMYDRHKGEYGWANRPLSIE